MGGILRRRELLKAGGGSAPVDTLVTISWTGSGSDQTSSPVIDATNADVYFSIPFVAGDTRLQATATAATNACKARSAALYSDAECTVLVGYYGSTSGQITSTRPTGSNSPWLTFDTEIKVAPRGYYVKLLMTRSGTDAFSSNANFRNYLIANATKAILRT